MDEDIEAGPHDDRGDEASRPVALLSGEFQELGAFVEQIVTFMKSPEAKGDASPIISERLEKEGLSLECYYNVQDDDVNGYKWYSNFVSSAYQFSSELCYLYDLNLTQEEVKCTDDNIDTFEVLKVWRDPSTIILLQKAKSKKILMISPRVAYLVSVVTKTIDGDIVCFFIGAKETHLRQDPEFSHLFETEDCLVIMGLGGILGKDTLQGSEFETYQRMNVLSNIGKIILKPLMKLNIRSHYVRYNTQIARFLMKRDPSELLWFESDPHGPLRVFLENLERFSASGLSAFGFSTKMIEDRVAELRLMDGLTSQVGNNSALLRQSRRSSEQPPSNLDNEIFLSARSKFP